MRTIRIYQPGFYNVGDEVTLLPQASLHVGVVLRMQTSERLTVFNGVDQEYNATLLAVTKKAVIVRIDSVQTVSRESPCSVHLAPGVMKGDHMEWLVQKAVELGVRSISPLLTQHTSVRQDAGRLAKKHAQWLAIAISACEQSGRTTLPIIHAPLPLPVYLQQTLTGKRWLLDPRAEQSWREPLLLELHAPRSTWHLLVGPEGGFHTDELQQAAAAQFESFHLGSRILRAETASIAALSVLQALFGDL